MVKKLILCQSCCLYTHFLGNLIFADNFCLPVLIKVTLYCTMAVLKQYLKKEKIKFWLLYVYYIGSNFLFVYDVLITQYHTNLIANFFTTFWRWKVFKHKQKRQGNTTLTFNISCNNMKSFSWVYIFTYMNDFQDLKQ